MELTKYKSNQILAHIKHDLRQLPDGKSYGNESVAPALTHLNYSLINRGKTATEINQYRKNFEKNIFKYNRSNLVHAVELVIQCPEDCPTDQHEAFFQTAFNWYCDTYLPAGKDCVFIAEVHKDEHKWIDTPTGKKDISKEHLHLAFVPVISAGKKHPNYQYRLNADALTKKAILRDMHPSLQKALDKAGIQATVYKKKNKNGKSRTISLSVEELKEITDKTGIVIDHSLTVEELGNILSKNVELSNTLNHLQKKYEKLYSSAQKLKHDAEHIIAEKNQQLNATATQNKKLKNELISMKETLQSKELELQQEHEKRIALEKQRTFSPAEHQKPEWGTYPEWGTSSGWNSKDHTIEEEINL